MNILTFDIEEWFHLLDNPSTQSARDWDQFESRIHVNMDRIFKLLQDTNTKATFFCLGWIAQKYPEVIKQIAQAGYEIGTHSDQHQLAYTQSKDEFKKDLQRSINILEDLTESKIRYYRAPGFSLKDDNKWVFDVLSEVGIEVDCSIFPAKRAHGGFESFNHAEPCWVKNSYGDKIKELPINTIKLKQLDLVYSGGGYFRLFPYWLIKKFFKRNTYNMAYFHPRDFDPGQPRINGLNWQRRFKSYVGLRACYSKLERLLNEVNFIDVGTAIEKINWEQRPTITLAKQTKELILQE